MARALAIETLLACLIGDPPPGADWESVIAGANRALATGTMAERLQQRGAWDGLPADVRGFLSAILSRARQRNARLDAQLAEALAALNRVDVVPILIKGAAIRFTPGAGAGAGRMLSDLDLMLPAEALPRAIRCLRAIGYRFYVEDPAGHLLAVLFRDEDVGMVDLHSRMKAPRPLVDAGAIARDSTPIAIGDARALLPSPTSQALMLVIHDQLQDRDYWRGLIDLRHLIDLDGLACSPAGIDWAALAAWCPSGYPARALQTALATAHGLLGTPVPPHLVSGWRPRLQFARRRLQARRASLRFPLTLLSLALDPPPLGIWARERIQYGGGARPRRRDFAALIAFGLRRISSQASPGKF